MSEPELAGFGQKTPKKRRRASRATKPRRRRTSKSTLADVLHAKLKDKKISVTEAADAVLASGYKTRSSKKNFRVMINQTLTKDKRFNRVSRGVYTAT